MKERNGKEGMEVTSKRGTNERKEGGKAGGTDVRKGGGNLI